jgi:phage shock protein A
MSWTNLANEGRTNVSDTIASRVTRVIGGSVHALLDAVENATPESTMAQAVREIDQAIDDVRAELGRVEAVKHLANSSLGKLNTQNETLADQIELAVAKGDDGLARAGIAKQVDIEDQIPVLQNSLQSAVERGRELESYIVALLAKKREMEAALQDFIAARNAAAVPSVAEQSNGTVQGKVDRAGSAFDRVLARQTGLTGVTSDLNPEASKLRDLQELARSHRIDERLAALKAAQGNQG